MSTHTDKAWVHRASFTLIELLVVIAIIGILVGMIFKMMAYATRDALTAATIEKLEKVAHTLEEYRAEYGQYPPVNFVRYEYENTSNQIDFLRTGYFVDHPQDIGFSYGLVAYLEKRDDGYNIEHTDNSYWIDDTPRDIAAKKRWAPFMDGVVSLNPDGPISNNVLGWPYWNDYRTVVDGWGKEIRYESLPPYLTYRLWSNGSDETDGTADDIHRDKWDN